MSWARERDRDRERRQKRKEGREMNKKETSIRLCKRMYLSG
jgi:hypothetical protein